MAPVNKYNYGSVSVAVFENEIGKGKDKFTTQSLVISKNYFDQKEKKWKSTQSFKYSDIPMIIMALNEAMQEKYSRTNKSNEVDQVDFEEE